jgi:hypothetical protein
MKIAIVVKCIYLKSREFRQGAEGRHQGAVGRHQGARGCKAYFKKLDKSCYIYI